MSTNVDFVWQKIRKTDNALNIKILKYFSDKYEDLMEFAWEEFHIFNDDTPEIDTTSPMFVCAFLPWLLYNWVPDENDENIDVGFSVPVAESYLCVYSHALSQFEKDFIVENLKSNYSYYEILSITKGQSLRVKDILRNREFVVQEKAGSKEAVLGHICLARILTISECTVFCGTHPFHLPAQFKINAVGIKQYYKTGDWLNEDLHSLDLEIRQLFLEVLEELQTSGMPQLSNTSGEDLLPSKLFFDLHCSCELAFDKLATLSAPLCSQEELVSDDIIYDEDGEISEVFLVWLVPSNTNNKSLNNTVFASIKISKNELVIEVNSKERAEKAKNEIGKLMGELVSYKTMAITPINDITQQSYGNSNNIDLNENPEIKEALQKIHDQHWQDWLEMNIPALDDKTPKEAAKTISGREQLEALFSDFHQKNLQIKASGSSQIPVDLAFLRKALDMA